MLRRTPITAYLFAMARVRHPPSHGYELALIPEEDVLREFLATYNDKLIHVVVANGEDCPLTKKITSVLHLTPLGHPRDVKLALLNAKQAPKLIRETGIMALPTTLVYFRGELVDRVVGIRMKELMTKSRFILRNHDMSPFSN
jgi:hypothetical protein